MGNDYVKSRESQLSRKFRPYVPVSPNELYTYYQDDTQMTAKTLYRETAIGKLLVDAFCRFVIGNGLVPMSSPETKLLGWTNEQAMKFQEQAEAWWRICTDRNIDFYGKSSFLELQKIAIKDICINGDTLKHQGFRKVKDGQNELVVPFVQIISGRMVTNRNAQDTKDCVGGVIFKNGKEYGYKIRILGNDFSDSGNVRIVNRKNSLGQIAFDLIQLGQTDPTIVRGVPLLTSLRDDILNIEKTKDNHTMQSVIRNLFTAFITHTQPAATPLSEKLKEIGSSDETSPKDIYMSAGNVVDLEEGESVQFTPRDSNNADYSEGLKTNIGLVASALGMSYETAMNTFNASFSASRAGISGTEKNAEIVRHEFERKFCQPVWEMVTEYGILTGNIEAPRYDGSLFCKRAMFSTTWTGVTPPTVDLTKEVNAYSIAVERGLCSKEYAIRALFGMDFDEVTDRTNKENSNTDSNSNNSSSTDNEDEEKGDDTNE